MAGHSKWANIKHRKAAVDAKRGKIFSKIAREITVSARVGGGDPDANIGLRALIQKARGVNMPADNITRAIKKGTGELKDDIIEEEGVYEGYASGGIGLIIEVLTDNKNRTAAEIRHAFTKNNANLATPGAVSRSFERKGLITLKKEAIGEEQLMELVLENGGEDFEADGDFWSITTPPGEFMNVVDALEQGKIPIENSEITMLASTLNPVTDLKTAQQVMRFVDVLEDLDDVQNVYTDMDLDEAVIAAMEAEAD